MMEQLDPKRAGLLEDRAERAFTVKGRLRRDAARSMAQAEMSALWSGLVRQYPDVNAHRAIVVRTELESRIQSDPWDAGVMALLLGLVVLVLVVSCANVANLMLGRVRTRARGMAIRLAIGVGRGRLIRQLLTESLLLALLGCGAGLVVAYGGIRLFTTIPVAPQVVIDPRLDIRVVAVSVAAALLSAVLFGLAPARQSLRTALVPSLKGSEIDERPRRRAVARHALVISQVAISMVLLVATALILDGFRKAIVLDPGFRTDHLIMMSLDPSLVRYTPEQTRVFYQQLGDRVRALPTVKSAALTSVVPFLPGGGDIEPVIPEGYELARGQESIPTFSARVDEHYFETMQVRIARGRAFTAADRAGTRGVAIVNQEFASRYWPHQDPIGKRIRLAGRDTRWLEVVGVTPTGKYHVGCRDADALRVPAAGTGAADQAGALRRIDDGRSVRACRPAARRRPRARRQPANRRPGDVRADLSRADRQDAVDHHAGGQRDRNGRPVARARGAIRARRVSVSRRTREIGIRMAIGADRSRVVSMVLRQGLSVALVGIGVGAIASIAVARVLNAVLVGLGRRTRRSMSPFRQESRR